MKESKLFKRLVATFVVIVLGGPAVVLADTYSYFQDPKVTLRYLDMLPSSEMLEVPASQIYAETHWTRAPAGGGGYFFPICVLGGPVEKGQVLGYIVDPLTDKRTIIEAP